MGIWQERGLAIANSNTIKKNKLGWQVPSQSGNGTYVVNLDHGEPFCTCPYYEAEHKKCQHIFAVEFIVQRETKPDGTVTETQTVRITYTQEWAAYNEAQTHEQERFVVLLRDLCDGIPQPEYRFGRPRLPLSDVVFAAVYKVYSTMSSRRFQTDLREAEANGLVAKSPSLTSGFRSLENSELTPLLKALIEQSASPLKDIETDFAVDSSGFRCSTFGEYCSYAYGTKRVHNWLKVHICTGVYTNVIADVVITGEHGADSPQFKKLINNTARYFDIHEVSADAAYSSRKNLEVVDKFGGTAYIPFKINATGTSKGSTLWGRAFHYFQLNKDEFMEHYHKRSNVESTFSAIKKKFGETIKSKNRTAQINEMLCKIIAYNLTVVIREMIEFGFDSKFLSLNGLQKEEELKPSNGFRNGGGKVNGI